MYYIQDNLEAKLLCAMDSDLDVHSGNDDNLKKITVNSVYYTQTHTKYKPFDLKIVFH